MTLQSDLTIDVVSRMRMLRERRGLTCEELAALMTTAGTHTTRNIITNLEAGRKNYLSVDDVVAASVALGVNLEYLLFGHGASCENCKDNPPLDFTCNFCKQTGPPKIHAMMSATGGF
jgi:transcriptional regulator with XRE-family HTH domain